MLAGAGLFAAGEVGIDKLFPDEEEPVRERPDVSDKTEVEKPVAKPKEKESSVSRAELFDIYRGIKQAEEQHLDRTLQPVLKREIAKVRRNQGYMRTVVGYLEKGKWQKGESVVDKLAQGENIYFKDARGRDAQITAKQYQALVKANGETSVRDGLESLRKDYVMKRFSEVAGRDVIIMKDKTSGLWGICHGYSSKGKQGCLTARGAIFSDFEEQCNPMSGLYTGIGATTFEEERREIEDNRRFVRGLLSARGAITRIGNLNPVRWICREGRDSDGVIKYLAKELSR